MLFGDCICIGKARVRRRGDISRAESIHCAHEKFKTAHLFGRVKEHFVPGTLLCVHYSFGDKADRRGIAGVPRHVGKDYLGIGLLNFQRNRGFGGIITVGIARAVRKRIRARCARIRCVFVLSCGAVKRHKPFCGILGDFISEFVALGIGCVKISRTGYRAFRPCLHTLIGIRCKIHFLAEFYTARCGIRIVKRKSKRCILAGIRRSERKRSERRRTDLLPHAHRRISELEKSRCVIRQRKHRHGEIALQAVGIGKVRFLEHYRIPTHGGHGHSGGRRNHLKSRGNLRSRSKRCRHTQAKKQRDRYQRHNVGNGFHIKPPSKNSGSRYYARALPFIL